MPGVSIGPQYRRYERRESEVHVEQQGHGCRASRVHSRLDILPRR